jgi:hypothetical protein
MVLELVAIGVLASILVTKIIIDCQQYQMLDYD